MEMMLLAMTASQHASLESVLGIIITAIISAVAGFIVDFFNKKKKEHRDDILINAALDMATSLVNATTQTVVDDLKSGGLFTPEKAQEVKEDVVETLKKQFSPQMIIAIEKRYNLDIGTFLKEIVEDIIVKSKQKKN